MRGGREQAHAGAGSMQARLCHSQICMGGRYASLPTAVLTTSLQVCNFQNERREELESARKPPCACAQGEWSPKPAESALQDCEGGFRTGELLSTRDRGKPGCRRHLWLQVPPPGHYGTPMILAKKINAPTWT